MFTGREFSNKIFIFVFETDGNLSFAFAKLELQKLICSS